MSGRNQKRGKERPPIEKEREKNTEEKRSTYLLEIIGKMQANINAGVHFSLQTIVCLFNESLSINLSNQTAALSAPLAQGKELQCHVPTKLPKLGVSR